MKGDLASRGRPTLPVFLTTEERAELCALARRELAADGLARRARAVLLMGEGKNNLEIARESGACEHTVGKWRKRFVAGRVSGLRDLARCGAPRRITNERVAEVVRLTRETRPKGARCWSTRRMAARCGISNERVARIWQANGLRPQLAESCPLAADPEFFGRVREVLGVYRSQSECVVVLGIGGICVPCHSRSAAEPGESNADLRRGMGALFAGVESAMGRVEGRMPGRENHREFLDFLEWVEAAAPRNVRRHLVSDKGVDGMAKAVRELLSYPWWQVQVVPTRRAWVREMERFFERVDAEGAGRFEKIGDLRRAMEGFVAEPEVLFRWDAGESNQ